MPIPEIERQVPGQRPSASNLNEAFGVLHQLGNLRGVAPIFVDQDATGWVISSNGGKRYLGKTTSTIAASDGTTPQSGTVEVYFLDAGTPAFVDAGFAVTAWSFLGVAIPTGTLVLLEEDQLSGNLLVAEAPAPVGITTADVSGTPSYPGSTFVKTTAAEGLYWSAAGVLHLRAADATHQGTVTTGGQIFKGNKQFTDTVSINLTNTTFPLDDHTQLHLNDIGKPNIIDFGSSSDNPASVLPAVRMQGIGNATADIWKVEVNNGYTALTLTAGVADVTPGNFHGRYIDAEIGFRYNFAGTIIPGLSTTVLGQTFTGGIITGTGAFSGGGIANGTHPP
jgi:hypothetical protein